MAAHVRRRMTADEFIAWAIQQPEGKRYELVDGEIVAMSPERAGHNRGKLAVVLALRQALRERACPCEVFTDGMSVRIDDDIVYEPDALIRCGERLGPDAVEVADPVVLVEMISPGTHKVDTGQKLADYFRLPSLCHYLIVNTRRRSVVHHERSEDGGLRTRIVADGTLELQPPGIAVGVAAFFADEA